jgi:hypothetical protein
MCKCRQIVMGCCSECCENFSQGKIDGSCKICLTTNDFWNRPLMPGLTSEKIVYPKIPSLKRVVQRILWGKVQSDIANDDYII